MLYICYRFFTERLGPDEDGEFSILFFNFLPEHTSTLNFEFQVNTEVAFNREAIDREELGSGILDVSLELWLILVFL